MWYWYISNDNEAVIGYTFHPKHVIRVIDSEVLNLSLAWCSLGGKREQIFLLIFFKISKFHSQYQYTGLASPLPRLCFFLSLTISLSKLRGPSDFFFFFFLRFHCLLFFFLFLGCLSGLKNRSVLNLFLLFDICPFLAPYFSLFLFLFPFILFYLVLCCILLPYIFKKTYKERGTEECTDEEDQCWHVYIAEL